MRCLELSQATDIRWCGWNGPQSPLSTMPRLARLWQSLEVPIGSPADRMESLAYSRGTAITYTNRLSQLSLNVLQQKPVPERQHP